MKRVMKVCRFVPQSLAILLAITVVPGVRAAGLEVSSAGLETHFTSRYTWRGMAYSTGAVAQPYGWITTRDFTISLWGNADLSNKRTFGTKRGIVDGGDVSAGWSHDFGRWRIEPGFEFWFARPVSGVFDPATGESSVRVSWRLGPIRLFVSQAIDVIRFRGAYYGEAGPNFTASRKGLDFDASLRQGWASAKFNRIYTGVDRAEPTFAGADGSITHRFQQGVYLRVHSEVTRMTDVAIRRNLQKGAIFSVSVAAGYEWRR
jgi:hypothetical protein